MNFFAHPVKQMIVALAAIILTSPCSIYGQGPAASQNRATAPPLNLLVLGDSILWGQGLKDEHKTWYQVKSWLQQNAGRDVNERIEAHSGAVLGSADQKMTTVVIPNDNEINSAVPTVNDELDSAIRFYRAASQVDLV